MLAQDYKEFDYLYKAQQKKNNLQHPYKSAHEIKIVCELSDFLFYFFYKCISVKIPFMKMFPSIPLP